MPPQAIAFDTHRFVKHLTEGGFTVKQAEEQVSLLNTNLATKADIEALRQETKAGIETLRQETRIDILSLKTDFWKCMIVGVLIAQGVLIFILI